MANSLSPAFVKINYVSAYAPHVMTIPAVAIQSDGVMPSGYEFVLRGAEVPVDVTSAVTDFVNVLKGLFLNTTTFVDFVAFQQPTPEDVPVPVVSEGLAIAGTSSVAGWAKATEATMSWRSTDFGIFKLVALDIPNGNLWDKYTSPGPSGIIHDLDAYITAPESWISARKGGRPNTFLQFSITLNEKLRRAYRMT